MTNFTQRLAAGIISIALLAPAFAMAESGSSGSGQPVTDTNAQIQALMSQIKALQQQLGDALKQRASSTRGLMHEGMMASTTPGIRGRCPEFMRDLKRGDNGDDVAELQRNLAEDKDVFPEGSVTGFFGPMTERAVKKFQEKFGISSSSIGFFGPRSREHMRGHCGIGKGDGDGRDHMMMGSSTEDFRDFGGNDDFHPMQDMRGPRGGMPIMGGSSTPRDIEHHGPQNF